ncbi:hypothetical protein F2Q70_00007205 [Brassica cretica]|uniref:Uncharacterized protein n=1 Tax=Brassica cretica TaxID=69181 RepID=A0A8S9M6S7_BRACR|nr:hypothetical protein F2Q70_00007205 [Brassica cretica]
MAARSEKLHHLMMAVLMLAMGFEQVVFAMGGEATWLPPLYFGICSVAYPFRFPSLLDFRGAFSKLDFYGDGCFR